LIAPRIGGVTLSDGRTMAVESQLAGTPSVLVDAVALALSAAGCTHVMEDAAAIQFVSDAYVHLKCIGHSREAEPLLEKARVRVDPGVVPLDGDEFLKMAGIRQWDREKNVRPMY